MTFCVGIHVREGLIALADTQIVRGVERHSKGKLAVLQHKDKSFFVMTSGLRSVRDKILIYCEEILLREADEYNRLYKIANLFGEMLRRVKIEDGPALAESRLPFNAHAVIGGQLAVLSFDMTRSSVTDVDFPIDIIAIPTATGIATQHRFDASEMNYAMQWWSERLADTLRQFPMDWALPLSIPKLTQEGE